MHDIARMTHQRRRVGGEEHLALADAQHHRAAVARHHDRVGLRRIQHGQPIGAADQPERRPHGGIERSGRHRGDQMRQHLGVGFRAEGDAFGFEPRPQCRGVLDDAVMDDRDAAGRVAMRMGVAVARFAMRRPAGMGDAGRAAEARRQDLLEFAHPALAFGQAQLAAAGDGDAGRIIAAIFEPMQSLDQDRRRVALADVTDDAAHGWSPQL